MTSIPWMKRSFGEDFAQLMDRITGVTLRGPVSKPSRPSAQRRLCQLLALIFMTDPD